MQIKRIAKISALRVVDIMFYEMLFFTDNIL